MKHIVLTTLSTALFHFNAWGADAPPVAEVKAVAGSYAKQLKSALQEAMGRGGPEAGIAACAEKAGQIGAEASRQSGWSIRRVTSQARNPLDMPDTYEQLTLERFEREIAGGKEDASRYEVVQEDGVRYARFMKAIRIEPVCLACHGDSEVAPGVAKRLSDLYPHDRARGYKAGDLRGALSIKIKLD